MQSPKRTSSPMNKKTTKRVTKTETITTTKTTVQAGNMSNTVFNNLMAQQKSNDELKYQIQQQQNDIDHLKNTLIGLNSKLDTYNDMEKDVQHHKHMLQENECARGKLQDHIVETSKKIEQDTAQHKSYQDTLISENQDLQRQMQALRQEMARQQQQHVDEQTRQQQ